jgi:hypothetical protein
MNRMAPLCVVAVAAALLAGCGANSSAGADRAGSSGNPAGAMSTQTTPGPATPSAPATVPAATATATPAPAAPGAALPVAPGAGALPQTRAFPSTSSRAWRAAMTDVWLAVTTGRASLGRPAFFPEAAYAQVKAIADPKADWLSRLWGDFALDVAAAHRVTGSHARLLRVDMAPRAEAAWVPPGACYNSIGYWHINGARLVYQAGGQERSIGIASLISWRGVWYVVHFGGVVRPAVGMVDDPQAGPGVPGPAGGC